MSRTHLAEADQNPWNNARQKESADRNFCGGAINDHHDAGGDDVADGGGCSGDSSTKASAVSLLNHGWNKNPTDSGSICRRGSGNAGEEHAGYHVDMC